MATLAVQKAPAVITYGAAAGGGDQFPAGIRRELRVKNGDGTSTTVTINSQRPCNQGFDHDQATVVAAGTEVAIGPLDPDRFADANGYVQATYSKVTSLTVAVVEV